MNQSERQSLRELHFLWKERECNYDGNPYPCDVIKVLDAWEAELGASGKTMTGNELVENLQAQADCNHVLARSIGDNTTQYISAQREKWPHCPKCGKKL
jgi:hypothetical protein